MKDSSAEDASLLNSRISNDSQNFSSKRILFKVLGRILLIFLLGLFILLFFSFFRNSYSREMNENQVPNSSNSDKGITESKQDLQSPSGETNSESFDDGELYGVYESSNKTTEYEELTTLGNKTTPNQTLNDFCCRVHRHYLFPKSNFNKDAWTLLVSAPGKIT